MTEIRVAAATEIGSVRRRNEDAYGFTGIEAVQDDSARHCAVLPQLPFLAVVADGLGGHPDGDIASRLVVETLLQAAPIDEDGLRKAVTTAHQRLVDERTGRSAAGSGSTVAAVLVTHDCGVAVNVGDSRIYLVEQKWPMTQVSIDDTPGRTHAIPGAASNALLQCLGPAGRAGGFEPHSYEFAIEETLRLMLCTDGLTSYVPTGDISDRIRNGSPEAACDDLSQLATRAGGHDNTTVVIIDVVRDERPFDTREGSARRLTVRNERAALS